MSLPSDYPSFIALCEKLLPYIIKVAVALCVFAAGMLIAKYSKKAIKRASEKLQKDKTLGLFIANLAYGIIIAVVIAMALGICGVQTASIIALLGAAGLAIGLALQASLSNLASGLILIAQSPFKVGDFIEGAGVIGKVQEIRLFSTVIISPENKKITIPNSELTGGNITNFSVAATRRIDITVSVAYSSDLDFVEKTISEVLEAEERVLKEPVPKVYFTKLNDNGIDILVRPWVESKNFRVVNSALIKAIKNKFDEAGIEIPYPQHVVHIHQK